MSKITAIFGGGDWADASVEHIVLPKEMDINRERELYKKWYYGEYCPALLSDEQLKFRTFPKWLIEKGARYTTDEELIEFWDE